MVAEKERGGNSSPAFFMKLTAALSGVALGVVAVLSNYEPIPAHADAGEFAGAVDYITSLSGTDAVALGSEGGAVAGLILAVYMLANPSIGNNNSFDVDSISYMSGYYLDADGETRIGVLTSAPSQEYRADGGFSVMYGYGVDLRCTYWDSTVVTSISNDNNRMRFTISGGFSRLSNVADSSGLLYNAVGNSNTKTLYGDPNASPPSLANQLAGFIGSNVISLTASGSLPSGTLDCADPSLYINNILRPYVQINYPDYVYLLPEAPQPSSEYATDDIVPGIPKDWTIINPELPTSPHLDLTIPEGDFQAIDPGDTFTGFASGVGFWWAMVNTILTTFEIKTLALALLAVAVAIFAMYKIGG